MEQKYKVVVTQGDCGVYWTEVIGVYEDRGQAADVAYEVNGHVEEVEEA